MTVPKMAKKTGGMAPKRKMKGGNDGELNFEGVKYTVKNTADGICVKVDAPAAESDATKLDEGVVPAAASDPSKIKNDDVDPAVDAENGEGEIEESFGGKKRKSNKRTQKKKGKKPRKSAKKAKK